ncbi:Histone acetyltransferase of the MYST family 2 [Bienertia sinuspersici]
MGSLDPPSQGGKALIHDDIDDNPQPTADVRSELSPTVNGDAGSPSENEPSKRRKSGVLPLEVGTRVMCRWRDCKYHPVKVIERRKVPFGGQNDYEYYVHYTECCFICSGGKPERIVSVALGLKSGCWLQEWLLGVRYRWQEIREMLLLLGDDVIRWWWVKAGIVGKF